MPSNPPYNDDWNQPAVPRESTLRVQDAPEVVREDAEGKPSEDHGDPATWSDENFAERGGVIVRDCERCGGDGKSHEDADSNHRIGVCPICSGSGAKPLSPDISKGLREVLEEVRSTLCACRWDNKPGCNCDIHAAHRIIDAALSLARPEGEVKVTLDAFGWCSSCDLIAEVSRPKCPDCGDWLVFGRDEESDG